MDRIDMWVPVLHVDCDTLSHEQGGGGSEEIRQRVKSARDFAQERFRKAGNTSLIKNKDLRAKDISVHVQLDDTCISLMKKMSTSSRLSPRAYHRVLRLARTIADYRGSQRVHEVDILEAFQYRPKLYQDRL